MTAYQLADELERIAVSMRKYADSGIPGGQPTLTGDFAVGGAVLWGFLRAVLLHSSAESFTRRELLERLEMIAYDSEIFPPGLVRMISECEEAKRVQT